MLKRTLIFSAMALMMPLGACNSNQEASENSPETVDAFVENGAKDLIKGKLKDPDSAVFTAVAVSRKSGHPMACGRVNSKNSFGGMTGPQRFVSNGGGLAVLEEEMADGEMDKTWERFC
ncbi:hypothetical protein EWE75_23490 [Sphingomonas populi]|uniref:Uncharacterized protein n=1 Tax=Sphingomonas populi TaxID=2484750 RepID=A0A4Q6XIP1_9SPHN|nr:hypothetical protein [Sphingomonas populi]RZF59115.1 hypothetical protein EWE75_23490 [Sphingomonas populi]